MRHRCLERLRKSKILEQQLSQNIIKIWMKIMTMAQRVCLGNSVEKKENKQTCLPRSMSRNVRARFYCLKKQSRDDTPRRVRSIVM